MENMNVALGIKFSLLNSDFIGVYEKHGTGYSLLLAPTLQEATDGVDIVTLVEQIKKLLAQQGTTLSDEQTKEMTDSLNNSITDASEGKKGAQVIVKLQMAFLYVRKEGNDANSTVEYAFQLLVEMKDVIPKELEQIVTVDNVSISVWNTTRKKVIEKMQLFTIADYIGTSEANKIEKQ